MDMSIGKSINFFMKIQISGHFRTHLEKKWKFQDISGLFRTKTKFQDISGLFRTVDTMYRLFRSVSRIENHILESEKKRAQKAILHRRRSLLQCTQPGMQIMTKWIPSKWLDHAGLKSNLFPPAQNPQKF